MNYWQRSSEERKQAWDYLKQNISPDIALVQEAVPPPDFFDNENVCWREIGGNRKWGSGIITKSFPVRDVEKVQLDKRYHGALIVGEASLPNRSTLTLISLYGLLDTKTYVTDTLHRMLSDLTPLLTEKLGKRTFVMGGDYNADRQYDKYYPYEPSHKIFFDRLEDFGLEDCLAKFQKRPVQTHRHKSDPKFPWQNDYLHASKKLTTKLISCKVLDNEVVRRLSDHNPVIAEFDFL